MSKKIMVFVALFLVTTASSVFGAKPNKAQYEVVPVNLPAYTSISCYGDGWFGCYGGVDFANSYRPAIYQDEQYSYLSQYAGCVNGVCPSLSMACGCIYDDTQSYPVVWKDNTILTLSSRDGAAYAVNKLGWVVGNARVSGTSEYDYVYHPFAWIDGNEIDLGSLGGRSNGAIGVNDLGQIVGTVTTDNGFQQAFIWQNGKMNCLGFLPGTDLSSAAAINNKGQVVGSCQDSSVPEYASRGFIWHKGKMKEIPGLGAGSPVPIDINDSGQVVGYSHEGNSNFLGFIYDNGKTTDLNALVSLDAGWTIMAVSGIDNDGAICVNIQQQGYPYDWYTALLKPLGKRK